ncbi:tripartite tricarboxylate transporter substrate-binding protein [Roseiarcaceae bacterium H3SJ34-1]|uniref:Bug family tripartite tricarboxylate transporter substrate binding protein n=1 Tax=Terripilifer ovatus TaxID=3032367 RepID=UPI003AB9B270|nr:tripartite tricarboxylate transporter substrate-binding protein [Roseiarcaceae bacterium H3SJ34-1]
MGKIIAAALLVLFVAGAQHGAQAQEAIAQFYKGKTITVIVGTSAGGGYDTYARTFARFMGRHLAGAPTIVVANMPGAGSNIMAANVAVTAPKDGSVIGAPFSTQPLSGILEDAARLRYDPVKLNYLGSATTDYFLCVANPSAPAKTFPDTFKTEIVMGGTAETGSTGYLPVMLNNVLGTKFKPVFGYPGSREIMAAIEKGELHGMCGINLASIKSQYANLMSENKIHIIVQESANGVEELNKLGIPRTMDFAKTDEQRAIMDIIYSQEIYARPYFVAPETPKDRVEALRKAFMDTWKDPDLLVEMKRMSLDADPTSGEDLQKLLAKVYASPPDIIAKTKEAIKVKR